MHKSAFYIADIVVDSLDYDPCKCAKKVIYY